VILQNVTDHTSARFVEHKDDLHVRQGGDDLDRFRELRQLHAKNELLPHVGSSMLLEAAEGAMPCFVAQQRMHRNRKLEPYNFAPARLEDASSRVAERSALTKSSISLIVL
jgi:hypothetical protein